ncbi:MAG: hypothetical protein HQK99_14910 [Nitrospirae bacterium]|nr:hypothetical protein [Nitrospirota bacterium]
MIKKLIVASLCAVALMAGSAAFAAAPDNYTGKMVIAGTGVVMEFARMGDKTRTDNPSIKGLVSISISSAKKSVSMYIPNKLYFEHPISTNEAPSLHNSNVVFDKKKSGQETIDGHPCIKYDTVYYLKDKPEDKYKAVIWEASDLGGLIIRYEIKMSDLKSPMPPGIGGQTVVTEIKDIKIGAATPLMFEVPKDYKKAGTMQELMAGAINQLIPFQNNNAPKSSPNQPPAQKTGKDEGAH